MMQRKRAWLALLTALMLVLAACSGDSGTSDTTEGETTTTEAQTTTTAGGGGGTEATTTTTEAMVDLSGTSVSILGPEDSDAEAGSIRDAMAILSDETGIEIEYTGVRDASDLINQQVAGGNPPDIYIFPQPGKLADFARQGVLLPLPDDVDAVSADAWPEAFRTFGNVDGTQYGVPIKADLKSLVWYQPSAFADNGYDVPQSWDELKALTNQMIADGNTPWCVGIQSGPATGWPFTDWMEDLILRFYPVDVYDQWVAGEVKFSDPRIIEVGQEILDLWNTPGAVFASGGSIASTPFQDNTGVVTGDCMMHRQANFFSSFWPEGTTFGDGPDAVNVFYFPPGPNGTRPVLGAGTLAGAFRDAPEVWEVMRYFAGNEYATNRQVAQKERKGGGDALSGFLTAANGVDLNLWNPLEQSMLGILQSAEVFRFDGSDLMPTAVGSGAFWTEATSAVNGDKTIEEAFAAIDAAWPSS